MISSSYMKTCLSAYFRFNKGAHVIATEAGIYNSDFMALHKEHLFEVEIKVSKADFNNDFRKPKHRIYSAGLSRDIPNFFYFAVPDELAEHALLKTIGTKYGVMVVKPGTGPVKSFKWEREAGKDRRIAILEGQGMKILSVTQQPGRYLGYRIDYEDPQGSLGWSDRIRVIKRADKIHTNPVQNSTIVTIMKRCCSELANLKIKDQISKQKIEK